MNAMKQALLATLLCTAWGGAAMAESPAIANPDMIRAQMVEGDYAVAYEAGKATQTADGLALAAECLLTEIMLGQADKNKKQAKRARDLAEAALDLDPNHQNARLQHAIADGFVTRETGNVSAWMKKLPQKTYDIVQQYRTDFPDDPRGDALLGAWHLAIAQKAENKNAKKWFDASIEQGRELYLKARAARPDDAVIAVNYALALIALSDEDFPDVSEARAVLMEVDALRPSDHLGQVLQGYGRTALARLDDRDAARDFAEDFLDGKMPE